MPRPARVLPERHSVWLVLRDDSDRVLLERRPPQGVWPCLWSLPEAPDADAARTAAMRLADLDGQPGDRLPAVRHQFTHFRLLASPIQWRGVRGRRAVADASALQWCATAEIAGLGIPAPVKKLLLQVPAPVAE